MMSLGWSQALAWRLSQQLLDPVGIASVAAHPSRTVPSGRGRSRPGRELGHQDVRVSQRHSPADALDGGGDGAG